MNVEKDIDLLKSYILNGEKQSIDKNDITSFDSADKIYACTNEDLFLYPNKKEKRVLSVTSSGDHILNAVLNGAKEVIGFDINRFCKYYSALKIAMIKKYEFNEYFSKLDFTKIFDDCYYLEDDKIFEVILKDVLPYLSTDERLFWGAFNTLIKKGNFKGGLFDAYSICLDICNLPWIVKDKYDELKYYLLKDTCKIRYVDSNINNLNNKVKGRFDSIYISNILGRMIKDREDEKTKLLLYLAKLLKKDGVIYNYDFWCSDSYIPTDEFNKYFYIETDDAKKEAYDDVVITYKKRGYTYGRNNKL